MPYRSPNDTDGEDGIVTMAEAADIKRIAEEVIADRFGDDATIISVSIKEDADVDGAEFIVVRVVYETATGKLDARKAAGMIRHLRSKLHDDISEDRFPLLSFISKLDAQAEAA